MLKNKMIEITNQINTNLGEIDISTYFNPECSDYTTCVNEVVAFTKKTMKDSTNNDIDRTMQFE
jgi:hypothetical protein